MEKLPRIWDVPLLLLLALVWASAFAMIKIAVVETGPVFVVLCRCAIGGALMFAVVAMMRRSSRWPVGAKQWFWLLLTGLFSTAVPFWLISFAEQKITSSMAGVLMTVGPSLAIVLGHYFTDDEAINRGKVIGVGVGFIGAVYLLREGVREIGDAEIFYPLAVVLATFCYSVGGVLAKRLPEVSSQVLAAVVLAVSSVAVLPMFLLGGDNALPDFAAISAPAWGALLWLGVMPSGAAFYLRYFLIKRSGYGFVSYVGYLIPVFAIIIGNLWLGEVVSRETIIIMGVILLGLLLTRDAAEFPWSLHARLTEFRRRLK